MTVSTTHATIDPKDTLLNDAAALQYMYVEFAQEDRQLAELGLASYAGLLSEDERTVEAEQRRRDGE
jgi:hypothetical protein